MTAPKSHAVRRAHQPPPRPPAGRRGRCRPEPAGLGRPRVRAGRRPRAVPRREDQLEAGRGRDDHRDGDPGELLREPDHPAAAVRGADRHQAALREGAAGADPPEGAARPVVEDRDLCDARGRPDVLPAVRLEQVGRAARQVPERRDPDRQGLVQVRRHHQGLARCRLDGRQAVRHPVRRRGHGAGLPQGPVRREGPEAGRHLRAARQQREGADRSERAHPRPRAARLRGRRPEHVHLPVAVPRLRRQLDAGQQRRRQFARGGEGARVVRRHADRVRAAGGAQLELARHRRRVLAGHRRDATSTRTRRPR